MLTNTVWLNEVHPELVGSRPLDVVGAKLELHIRLINVAENRARTGEGDRGRGQGRDDVIAGREGTFRDGDAGVRLSFLRILDAGDPSPEEEREDQRGQKAQDGPRPDR